MLINVFNISIPLASPQQIIELGGKDLKLMQDNTVSNIVVYHLV
jgi:hypothetical protein